MQTLKNTGGRFVSAEEMKDVISQFPLDDIDERLCKLERVIHNTK